MNVIKVLPLFLLVTFSGIASAQTTPTTPEADMVDQKLDEAKADVEKFKNAWDKARLEVTLYEKRAKRATEKIAKAAKANKAKAIAARDKADLELQLSVERRKLAFSQWQGAQLRQLAEETRLKVIAQDKETKAIEEKMEQLQTKLGPATPSATAKPR